MSDMAATQRQRHDGDKVKRRRIRTWWANVRLRRADARFRRRTARAEQRQAKQQRHQEAQQAELARRAEKAAADRRASDTTAASEGARLAYGALLAFTVLVAGVTFVLSFHGLSDYGERVAGATGWLSALVPIGVDGLTLCAIAATFVLATAPFRVRFYAWCVFSIAVGASVAGNLSHAESRHLTTAGMVGAAAWPVLLALASHLVIVVRRAIARRNAVAASHPAPAAPSATVSPDSNDTTASATATPPAPRQPEPRPARQQPRRKPARPNASSSDLTRQQARNAYRDGDSCADIASRLGVAKRSVERWTADLRDATPGSDTPSDTNAETA